MEGWKDLSQTDVDLLKEGGLVLPQHKRVSLALGTTDRRAFGEGSAELNSDQGKRADLKDTERREEEAARAQVGVDFKGTHGSESEWQREILRHHTNPGGAVNWGNCRPPAWRQDPWEVAKAYMPRGQTGLKGPEQCDASALLNLLNYCDRFRSIDQGVVREVIRCRNELMHSCEMRMGAGWMKGYHANLSKLLQHFSSLPEMAAVAGQIQEVLTTDWSVCVPGVDGVDAAQSDGLESDFVSQWEVKADSISQWEVELLRERLGELFNDTEEQHSEELLKLRDFLLAHKDLGELFSPELQAISSPGAKRRREGDEGAEEEGAMTK
ncbi:uncharacterized protein CXorf38-like [Aplochiton taeniatus]